MTATLAASFEGPWSPLKLSLGLLELGVIMEVIGVGRGARALAAEGPLVHLQCGTLFFGLSFLVGGLPPLFPRGSRGKHNLQAKHSSSEVIK